MARDGESQVDFPRESPLDREYTLESRIKLPRLGEVLVFRNQDGLRIMAKEKVQSNVEECRRDIQQAMERMKLNHPHLLQMLDYSAVKGADGKFVVRGYYELASRNLCAELEQRRKEGRPMVAEELRNLLIDILEIMASLKDSKMIHGDIRPEYVIFDPETEVYKLADRLGDPSPPTLVQTRNIQKQKKLYLSPQLFYNLSNQHRQAIQGKADPNFEPVKLNPYLSEGYSLGLVVLEASLLDDVQSIYNLQTGKINEGVLEQKLADFAERYEDKDVGLVRAVQDLLEVSEEERPDLHLLLTGLKSTPQNSEYGEDEEGDYIFKNEQQELLGPLEHEYNQNAGINPQFSGQGGAQANPAYGIMKTSHGVVIEEEDEEGSDTRQGIANIFKEEQIQHLAGLKGTLTDPKADQTSQNHGEFNPEAGHHKLGQYKLDLEPSKSHTHTDENPVERVPKLSDALGQSTQQSSDNSQLRTQKGEESIPKPAIPSISLSSIHQNPSKVHQSSSSEWEQNMMVLKAQRDEMIANLQKLKEAGHLAGYDMDQKKSVPDKRSDPAPVNIFKEDSTGPGAKQQAIAKQTPIPEKPRDYVLNNKSNLSSSRLPNESQIGATPETTVEPENFKPAVPAPQVQKQAPESISQPTQDVSSEKPPSRKQTYGDASFTEQRHPNGPSQLPEAPTVQQQFSSNGGAFAGSSSRRGEALGQYFQSSNTNSNGGLVNFSSKPGLYGNNINYSSTSHYYQGSGADGHTEQTPSTHIKDLTPARSQDTPNVSSLQRSDGAFASRTPGDSSPKPTGLSHHGHSSSTGLGYSTLNRDQGIDLNQTFSPQFMGTSSAQVVQQQPTLQRDNSRNQMAYTPTRGVFEEKRSGSVTPLAYQNTSYHSREQGLSVSPTPSIVRDNQNREVRRELYTGVHSATNQQSAKFLELSDGTIQVLNPSATPAATFDPSTGQYSYPKPVVPRYAPAEEPPKAYPTPLRTQDINFSSHYPEIIRADAPRPAQYTQGSHYTQTTTEQRPALSQGTFVQNNVRYDSSAQLHQTRDVSVTHVSRDHSPYISESAQGRFHHPLIVQNTQSRKEMQPIVIRSRSNTPIRNTLTGIASVAHTMATELSVDRSPAPVYRQSGSSAMNTAAATTPGGLAGEINRHMAANQQGAVGSRSYQTPAYPGYSQPEQSNRVGSYTQQSTPQPYQPQAAPTSYGYVPSWNSQQPAMTQATAPTSSHYSALNSGIVGRSGADSNQTTYKHIQSTPSPIRGSGAGSYTSTTYTSQNFQPSGQQTYNGQSVRYPQADVPYTRLQQTAHQGSESQLSSNRQRENRQVLGALSTNTGQNSNSNLFQSGGQGSQRLHGGSGLSQNQYPQQVVRPPPDAKVFQYYTSSKTTLYENAPQSAVYRPAN